MLFLKTATSNETSKAVWETQLLLGFELADIYACLATGFIKGGTKVWEVWHEFTQLAKTFDPSSLADF